MVVCAAYGCENRSDKKEPGIALHRVKFCAISFAFCLAIPLIKSSPGCKFSERRRISCESLNLSMSEPIQNEAVIEYENKRNELFLGFSSGSISVKTLSTFPEVEVMYIVFCGISYLENGALCSLPKLKNLTLNYNQFPLLTKAHFSGCSRLEHLACAEPLEENALAHMWRLKSLQLVISKYSKTYIRPLKKLTHLYVETGELSKIEPGLFCLPNLEDLTFLSNALIEITESLFEGCSSIKEMYLGLYKGVIPEGQNPFSNLTHLKSLKLEEIVITHLTKTFFRDLPNLESFTFTRYPMKKLVLDYNSFVDVPNLTELILKGASLKDSDLERLYFPTNLEHLELHYNEFKNIGGLKSLPKLRYLSLISNNIVNFDLAALKKKFPKLETIRLHHNPLEINFVKELKKEEVLKIEMDYYKLD